MNNNLTTNVGDTSEHILPLTNTTHRGIILHQYVTTKFNQDNSVKNTSMHIENSTRIGDEKTHILQTLNYFRSRMVHQAKGTLS